MILLRATTDEKFSFNRKPEASARGISVPASRAARPRARLRLAVKRFSSSPRSGFTLLEVSVAGFLLVILMAVTVQVLGWAAAERVAIERRQWAIQEAGNIMERLTAQPWEGLTAETAAAVELSPQAREMLSEADLKIEVADEPDQSGAKRLTVRLRWQRRPGQPAAPVRLTAWVYRQGGNGA